MLMERSKELNTYLYRSALKTLRTLIRTSTSSMTESVPKPLKFLHSHYPGLQELFETWPAFENKSLFAVILSDFAITYSDTEPRGTLCYRLLSASYALMEIAALSALALGFVSHGQGHDLDQSFLLGQEDHESTGCCGFTGDDHGVYGC
ncbi:hypothetical protein BDR06DRAFT_1008958 [Suillus hirtellus]|nr:hypothetical protein BDR06DRAFT_1008958 [Suillus hirtellus]